MPVPFREAVEAGDIEAAIALLHDDVVFRSPAVHTPYHGKAACGHLLGHVEQVFSDFRYVDELDGGDHVALVFEARVGDKDVMGLDHLRLDDEGRITELTVMIRPLSGLIALAQAMAARLEEDPVPA
jgi:ketosteroid isomerase-like protein